MLGNWKQKKYFAAISDLISIMEKQLAKTLKWSFILYIIYKTQTLHFSITTGYLYNPPVSYKSNDYFSYTQGIYCVCAYIFASSFPPFQKSLPRWPRKHPKKNPRKRSKRRLRKRRWLRKKVSESILILNHEKTRPGQHAYFWYNNTTSTRSHFDRGCCFLTAFPIAHIP